MEEDGLKPCPFCGSKPKRWIEDAILFVQCPNCLIGFHNHVRLGCLADSQWNERSIPANIHVGNDYTLRRLAAENGCTAVVEYLEYLEETKKKGM